MIKNSRTSKGPRISRFTSRRELPDIEERLGIWDRWVLRQNIVSLRRRKRRTSLSQTEDVTYLWSSWIVGCRRPTKISPHEGHSVVGTYRKVLRDFLSKGRSRRIHRGVVEDTVGHSVSTLERLF